MNNFFDRLLIRFLWVVMPRYWRLKKQIIEGRWSFIGVPLRAIVRTIRMLRGTDTRKQWQQFNSNKAAR